MITKNIVLIETMDTMGTGLLYPCIYNDNRTSENQNIWEKGNAYILITNHHVLGDLSSDQLEENVCLTFYDDFGDPITYKDIWKLVMFDLNDVEKDEYPSDWDRTKDIVALLVVLKKGVKLTLSTKVNTKLLENRETVYVEGYPGVLLEQEVSQRLQLEGMEKSIFPVNKKVGAYQITDDYHWYNSMADLELLEGMSGSPVFNKKDGEDYILGINQSVANVGDGKNPFKIVYYLRIEYILNFLRDKNCIIYRRINENEFLIEWLHETKLKKENDMTILMIGGSGAGKTSIAKDFAFHGDKIDATNDGQTTRTDVVYNYSIDENEPRMVIRFLSKDDFEQRMFDHLDTSVFGDAMEYYWHLRKELVMDERKLMINLHHLFKHIKEKEKYKKVSEFICENTMRFLDEQLDSKTLVVLYNRIINKMDSFQNKGLLRYILDEEALIEYIKERDYKSNGDGENQKDRKDDMVRQILNKWCDNHCKNKNEIIFENFRKEMVNHLLKQNEASAKDASNSDSDNDDFSIKKDGDGDFMEGFIHKALHCEGFFGLNEFQYLFGDEKWVDSIYSKWKGNKWKKDYVKDLNKIPNESKDEESQTDKGVSGEYDDGIEEEDSKNGGQRKPYSWNVYNTLRYGYQKTYDILKEAYIKDCQGKYDDSKSNAITIRLDTLNSEKRKLLGKCLQVQKDGSLTGVIEHVEIFDKISNEYAFILNEFNIRHLRLIDTCGLDHLATESEKDIVRRLNHYYYQYINNKENNKASAETAVLFVKKLDSGKPDELRILMPSIIKSIPQAPVYCAFTGVDIFYRTEEEIRAIDWSISVERCPKVVKYILEGQDYFDKFVSDSQYLVLKNNMIPYCGQKSKVRDKFSYEQMNYQYMRKMIASIAMQEYSSIEVVDLDDEKMSNEILLSIAREFVNYLFANATLEANGFRWNTVNADATSVYRNKFGYSYTYDHCFYQIFHEAYVKTINEIGKKLIVEREINSSDAILSSMMRAEQRFLGNNDNLYKMDLEEDNKNEFRKVLDEMYKSSITIEKPEDMNESDIENQLINIFALAQDCPEFLNANGNSKSTKIAPEYRKLVFNSIYGFKSGLTIEVEYKGKSKTVCEHLADIYVKKLKEQIMEDNLKKSSNLVKISKEYYDQLQAMQQEFKERYGIKERERFCDLMIHFFENEKKNRTLDQK